MNCHYGVSTVMPQAKVTKMQTRTPQIQHIMTVNKTDN